MPDAYRELLRRKGCMSFFTNLRADRLITEIRSSPDPTSSDTQKAVARLKEVGPGAIEAIFGALPEVDKGARWDPVELGPIVAELLAKARPPVPVYGA